MSMVKKRVAELEGAQLDWAVAVASGEPLCVDAWQEATKPGTLPYVMVGTGKGDLREYYPSSYWVHGGPIIEREKMSVYAAMDYSPDGGQDRLMHWTAVAEGKKHRVGHIGPTPLIAAMRAFVASKLGDEVEVPE